MDDWPSEKHSALAKLELLAHIEVHVQKGLSYEEAIKVEIALLEAILERLGK
jgi:hypothetical protein